MIPETVSIYQVGQKIGSGSFGDIYIGKNQETNEPVAIKVEERDATCRQLAREALIYQRLGNDWKPKIHWLGRNDRYQFMVMDLMGPSLEDLFQHCNKKFSLKTTLILGIQAITLLERMHRRRYVHRDIKPDNFVMGAGDDGHTLHLIDFGLSKRIFDDRGSHIPYKEGKDLVGTARYTSINAHKGIEQTRRDDLEALGHVLLYLHQGKLPWQGLKSAPKEDRTSKVARIGWMKKSLTIQQLCNDAPLEFMEYMRYVRALGFDETPDYNYLRKLFQTLFDIRGYKMDYQYDWTPPPCENS